MMHAASLLMALAACLSPVAAQVSQGFNYGSTFSDGSPITEPAYEAQFNAAKKLAGTSGFTSARLFTSIQAPSQNTPSDAFQAAVNTNTPLLLGIWGSGGQAAIDNELAALRAALAANGDQLARLVIAISVGSEDLYRISPTGIENNSGVGAGPDVIANYIGQMKSAITSTALAGKPVGHVDTWTAYVNSSNNAVISASDFLGMDAYPYFQNTFTNDIGSGASLFFSAYDQTVAAAQGKPVWVTETGWPVSGKTENLAIPSTDNAKTYWDQVGCARLFGKINTWWYTLQDAFPSTPNPSFGVVGAGSSGTDVPTTPLYDLSCSGVSSAPPSSNAPTTPSQPAASEPVVGNTGAQRQNAAEQQGGASGGGASGGSASGGSTPAQNPPAGNAGSPQGNSGSQQQGGNAASPPASNAPGPTTLITSTTALQGAPSATNCPASLQGQFEYPHLIVPISKDKPDTAQGTSFNGTISPTVSSIFNFDFPASLAGKTCTLVFLLPTQNELTTSSFTLSGSGGFDVLRLKEPATEQTTYNQAPAVDEDLGTFSNVTPGQEYVIAAGPCYTNTRKGYELTATGSFNLNYFQDYNPSPIGLYVTVC